jgi:hypothetical protein
LSLTQKLAEVAEANPGGEISEEILTEVQLVGKLVANASAYCEHNRVRQVLAVLKPGAEDLYGKQDKEPLLGSSGVDALQQMRDTEKLAEKLHILKPGRPGRGKGKGRQNSRMRGAPAAGALQPAPYQAANHQPAAGKGRGRGKGKG